MPYITVFVAIAGITAGIAAKTEGDALNAAFFALKDIDGVDLLKLAVPGVLLDIMLYIISGVFYEARLNKPLAATCLWFKMYIMGYFIKCAFGALPVLAAILLLLLALAGGGAVCGAVLIRPYEDLIEHRKGTGGLRRYLIAAGIMTEGIIIPSAARVLSLLCN